MAERLQPEHRGTVSWSVGPLGGAGAREEALPARAAERAGPHLPALEGVYGRGKCICIYIHMHMYTYTHVSTYICITSVHVCVCMFIYIYI